MFEFTYEEKLPCECESCSASCKNDPFEMNLYHHDLYSTGCCGCRCSKCCSRRKDDSPYRGIIC